MKKTELEGEVLKEVKLQLDQINGIKKSVENLSMSGYELERKMWKYIRKEFPDMSDNCSLETKDEKIIFTDRLSD